MNYRMWHGPAINGLNVLGAMGWASLHGWAKWASLAVMCVGAVLTGAMWGTILILQSKVRAYQRRDAEERSGDEIARRIIESVRERHNGSRVPWDN